MLRYPMDLISQLAVEADTRVLFVVLDGLGDVPVNGQTPLSAANTPNLDALAKEASLGLSTPIAPGISPGSGPGHLALFGYDPLHYSVGRGVLSALGIGLDLEPHEVAARGNFATLAPDGTIADRRAGRIPTELNERLIAYLREHIQRIEDVDVRLYTEAEYRFVLVLSGPGLGDRVHDTDPGRVGEKPLPATPLTDDPDDVKTARVVNEFVRLATQRLHEFPEVARHDPPPNTVLVRGIGRKPALPDFNEMTKMRAGAVAVYPMYRGVARLVGMELLPIDLSGSGERTPAKVEAYRQHARNYEYIYFHVKKVDSYGEDGNFEGKVSMIEEFDQTLPALLESYKPDVVLITGDHSTPVRVRSHSWHPLPVLLHGPYVRPDGQRFTEMSCRTGSLGHVRHLDLLPLVMANAGRLARYGA